MTLKDTSGLGMEYPFFSLMVPGALKMRGRLLDRRYSGPERTVINNGNCLSVGQKASSMEGQGFTK